MSKINLDNLLYKKPELFNTKSLVSVRKLTGDDDNEGGSGGGTIVDDDEDSQEPSGF